MLQGGRRVCFAASNGGDGGDVFSRFLMSVLVMFVYFFTERETDKKQDKER